MGTQPDTERLRELSLFTGAGGGLLGSLLLGWQTVCCVEWNNYCQRVLRQRMLDGWLDDCPIWDNVRTFDGRPWRGRVDVLTAGFPCQPFSVAGKQGADKDGRNMWPDTARILREVRPPVALLENVTGLTSGRHGYFGHILGELSESGYDATWETVPAAAADAPHRRERLWILAWDTNADRGRLSRIAQCHRKSIAGEQSQRGRDALRFREAVANPQSQRRDDGVSANDRAKRGQGDPPCDGGKVLADTDNRRPAQTREVRGQTSAGVQRRGGEGSGRRRRVQWPTEPDVGRLVDGLANRVDRLKALGNGQVPHQMALAWTILSRRMCRLLDQRSSD